MSAGFPHWMVLATLLAGACVSAPRGTVAPFEPTFKLGPRLRILGIAQDGGLPHVACDCERCDAAQVWFVHLNHSNPVLDPSAPERFELDRRGYRVAAAGDEFPL